MPEVTPADESWQPRNAGANRSGGGAVLRPAGSGGEDAPRLGDSAKADLPRLVVETPLVAFRVDQDELLWHGPIISGGCDHNPPPVRVSWGETPAAHGSAAHTAPRRAGAAAAPAGSIRLWLKS